MNYSLNNIHYKFNFSRPQKNCVKKFDERNDQRKLLFDDHAFHLLFKTIAGSEFNFRNVASQILANFFAVLNFCFFSFKRKEEINKFLVTSNYSFKIIINLPSASRFAIINFQLSIVN
jgi:hypothetical protein